MTLQVSSVSANRGSPKSCNQCALLNGGEVKMCKWDGNFNDPETAYCCQKDKFSEYCVDAQYNECSPYLDEEPHRFYNFCPNISEEKCKSPLVIQASTTAETKNITGLSYANNDTCYYIVENPEYEYMDGARVYLEFESFEPGVNVMLRSSSGIKNSTDANITGLSGYTPESGVTYSIDQGDKFIITVVPTNGASTSGVAFKFSTDGTQYDTLYQYYHEYFKKNDKGDEMLYIALGCAGFLVLLFFICICCCIKACCCKKKNQIQDSSQAQYSEMAQLAKNKQLAAENALSATEGAGQDLELESIHGSNDGDATA